jgi:hypothetical protein
MGTWSSSALKVRSITVPVAPQSLLKVELPIAVSSWASHFPLMVHLHVHPRAPGVMCVTIPHNYILSFASLIAFSISGYIHLSLARVICVNNDEWSLRFDIYRADFHSIGLADVGPPLRWDGLFACFKCYLVASWPVYCFVSSSHQLLERNNLMYPKVEPRSRNSCAPLWFDENW